MSEKRKEMYVIYREAAYQSNFVVKRFLGESTEHDPKFEVRSSELEILREMLLVSFNKTCLGRKPEDDFSIVESWT